MAQHRESGLLAQGRAQRRHHISAIAHHFFDDEEAPTLGSPDKPREIAVCDAGNGQLGAWVSAGLARASSADSVILAEPSWLHWSATSYLQGANLAPWESGGRLGPSWAGGADTALRFWRVPSLDEHPESTPRILVRNLGTFNKRHLSAMEAIHLGANPAGFALPGAEVLVWCLASQQANCLEAALALGRVVVLLRPLRLEVMVGDPWWLPRARTAPVNDPGKFLGRCRQLVSAVVKDLPVFFNHIREGDHRHPEMMSEIFQQVRKRVRDSD